MQSTSWNSPTSTPASYPSHAASTDNYDHSDDEQLPIPNPFTLAAYLRARPHGTLDQLRTELTTYEHGLSDRLVTLVNQEYPSILKLVSGLDQVDRALLDPLATPWRDLRGSMVATAGEMRELLGQVEERMAHRAELTRSKQTLQRMLSVAQSVKRTEAWLGELTESSHGDGAEDDDGAESGPGGGVDTGRRASVAAGKGIAGKRTPLSPTRAPRVSMLAFPAMARSRTEDAVSQRHAAATSSTVGDQLARLNVAGADTGTTTAATAVAIHRGDHTVYRYIQRMKHLERIALEYNQLRYLRKKTPDLPFVAQQLPRIQAIQNQLEAHLAACMDYVLFRVRTDTPRYFDHAGPSGPEMTAGPLSVTGHTPGLAASKRTTPFAAPTDTVHLSGDVTELLTQCLRIYVILDGLALVRQAVSSQLVRPLLKESLSVPQGTSSSTRAEVAATAAAGNTTTVNVAEGAPKHYRFALQSTLQWITERLYPIHRTAAAATATLPGTDLDLFNAVLWPDLAAALKAQWLPSLNNPGLPNRFQAAYTLTTGFVTAAANLFLDAGRQREFQAGAVYRRFLKLWQVQPYFSIRATELLDDELGGALAEVAQVQNLDSLWRADLNAALAAWRPTGAGTATASLNDPSAVEDLLLMNTSQAFWRTLLACGADTIYLPALAGKFWRLHVQCLQRYGTWLEQLAEPFREALEASPLDSTVATSPNDPRTEDTLDPSAIHPFSDDTAAYTELVAAHPALSVTSTSLPSLLRSHRLVDILAYLIADVAHLTAAAIASPMLPARLARISQDSPDVPLATRTTPVVRELQHLRRAAVFFARALALNLATAASEVLIQVRQVTSQYRHTARPVSYPSFEL
ncbi:hypothetical protein IWQ60_012408 [Tieghemiomyces parasiticus]|uniref:Conserved oligomeric Golgi complex subunit 2 n=1 Tax=Tieghemiomyces parasiticus TaxID=78921 RepID=A0A9W7ZI09_9FUNG|nr:hypothetical protein IWQ60_012408 [Tieghemiomyces parasiticus]